MKREIITDVIVLHNKSDQVDINGESYAQVLDTINDLWDSIPEKAYGLAAPQIGIKKRVFVASLSIGKFAFINPQIMCNGYTVYPSEEGCLSLPGLNRTVGRSPHVLVHADKIMNRTTGEEVAAPMELQMHDAFIVQHEHDHLDGVLISDLKEYEFIDKDVKQRLMDREKRIVKKRNKKLSQKMTKTKVYEVQISEKDKKKKYKERKKELKRLEIQERFNMQKEELISTNPASDSNDSATREAN